MARRRSKQLALSEIREKRDDNLPRDIGLNLLRVTKKHYEAMDLDFLSQCDVEEQVVSRDEKAGLFWVRGTIEMRKLFGVEESC